MARARPAPRDAPRVPLNRERVLGAALALADGSGVESLSMRRLAKDARRRGDVALQPRREQGRPARRPRRPRVRGDRAAGVGRRLAHGDARARDLDPRGAAPPPLGDRPDGGALEARAREHRAPRGGAQDPPRGGLLARGDGPRLLGAGRVHLRLRAAGAGPAGVARDARGRRGGGGAADEPGRRRRVPVHASRWSPGTSRRPATTSRPSSSSGSTSSSTASSGASTPADGRAARPGGRVAAGQVRSRVNAGARPGARQSSPATASTTRLACSPSSVSVATWFA